MWRMILVVVTCFCSIGCPADKPSAPPPGIEDRNTFIQADNEVVAKIEKSKRTNELVTSAINCKDWDGLKKLTRQGMRANKYIEQWKTNPVLVGALKSVQHNVQREDKSCTSYSYQMQYRDGKLHPHWLTILVSESDQHSELLDFYEFGW